MNFKKLLFALANLSIVTSPLLAITACTPKSQPVIPDELINISDMSDVSPYEDQINAADFARVTPEEMFHIFDDAVALKLQLYTSIDDLTQGIDYDISVKTATDTELPLLNPLTSVISADRTFKVVVSSLADSDLITGQTQTLTVTLPIQLPKQNVNQINTITILTTDYPDYIPDPSLATSAQITNLIESKIQPLIIALNGAASTASQLFDYTVLVQNTNDDPLAPTYDLTQVGGKNFKVTITANTSSRKLTGSSTSPINVNFPQAV